MKGLNVLSIVIIDEEMLKYITICLGVVLLAIALSPAPIPKTDTKAGKIFAGLAIAIVVGFFLFVWIYVRAR